MRRAFTLIEILVSVLILSGSIVYVLKIHSQSREQVIYITERNRHALEDSLFLDSNIFRYHKEKKNAYDLLQTTFKIDEFASRKFLKSIEREIYLPDVLLLAPEEEMTGPAARVSEIKIKGTYSSSYFRFKLQSF